MFYEFRVINQMPKHIQDNLYIEFNIQNERFNQDGCYIIALIQINHPDELWGLQEILGKLIQLIRIEDDNIIVV